MPSYNKWRTGSQGIVVGALLLACVGCSQPLTTRERGTLAGGALGAGAGALIGAATGAPGAGAAIGGALGAIGGAVTSDQLQAQDNLLAAQQREIEDLRQVKSLFSWKIRQQTRHSDGVGRLREP